ncbi:uncharacterized protein EI90DRAFT_3117003 [Cantharellus anzutake]|uniref:uncharacterized protein n=1 Tax=Cantharellus anzutake TaxID=1750568 RepID=UPI0019061CA6|nr:uncharacterized protein EI90DRAFT_3117003 [Cantharellus anzutake]KAF8340458.1 hypothetical protein EI90DRAFT_3117003 [Cantharellus anzutake]
MALRNDADASLNEQQVPTATSPSFDAAPGGDELKRNNIPPNSHIAQLSSSPTSLTPREPLTSPLRAPSASSFSSSYGASSTNPPTDLYDHESKAGRQLGTIPAASHPLSDWHGATELGNKAQTGGGVWQYLVQLFRHQVSSSTARNDEKGNGLKPPTQFGGGRDSSDPSVFAPGRKDLASMITRLKNQERSHEQLQRDGCELGGPNAPVRMQCGNTGSMAECANDGLSHYQGPESEFDLVAHVPPDAYMTFSTHVYFDELKKSSYAQHASIVSVRRFGDKYARKHRCLVLHVARDGMPDFGLRIDCFRDHTLSLFQSIFGRETPQVFDRVIVSGDQNLLYDDISGEEAVLDLPQPVPLPKFGIIFETVLTECRLDDRFAKENCWFVVSAFEELFVDIFGAGYTKGEPMSPPVTKLTRSRIGNALGLQDSK